jgi:hypothetical protein
MPSKSKSQQQFFGMVHAYQQGKLDTSDIPAEALDKIRKAASSMKKTDAKKMASTKHKGLPKKIKENAKGLTFKQYLVEQASNA